jgi:glycosyltransferase involved in cell wall biosynthesis
VEAPLISFISPNFNRAEFIRATMDSLLAQTDPRWENVIVDDGSTDDSVAIIESYVAKDPRIRFFRRDREPKGACPCRNIGVEEARGKYVVFLDTDDVAAPHCAEQRIRTMEAHPDLDFGVFQAEQFEHEPGDLNVWWNVDKPDVDELTRQFLQDALCQGTGPTFKKEAFERVGGWDETLSLWQDIDLFFRLFIQGYKYGKFFELPTDVHIREFRGSISRSDFFARHKFDSRFRVVKTAVRLLLENGMPGRVREARFMAAELIIGSARSHYLSKAVEILSWAIDSGVITRVEHRGLRLFCLATRFQLTRLPFARRWFEQASAPFIPDSESSIGRVPLCEPPIVVVA